MSEINHIFCMGNTKRRTKSYVGMTFYLIAAILFQNLCYFGTGTCWTLSSTILIPLGGKRSFALFPVLTGSALHRPLHPPTRPPPWISSSLYSVPPDDEQGDTDDGLTLFSDNDKNPLVRAGVQMKVIDVDVGDALIEAGRAWSSDWSVVTESLEEASNALLLLSSSSSSAAIPSGSTHDPVITTTASSSLSSSSSRVRELWRAIALELKDISTIEGCSSVGPPSSIPNWITIQDLLEKELQNEPTNQEEGNNDHNSDLTVILERIRMAINDLIESI